MFTDKYGFEPTINSWYVYVDMDTIVVGRALSIDTHGYIRLTNCKEKPNSWEEGSPKSVSIDDKVFHCLELCRTTNTKGLRQFRYIPILPKNENIRKALPELYPYTGTAKHPIQEFDPMFYHELGHCVEMFLRDKERLKIHNFGYGEFTEVTHTKASATTECRVLALQYLIEEYCTGTIDNTEMLAKPYMSTLLHHNKAWTNPEDAKAWKDAKSASDRIDEFMEFYRPNFEKYFKDTIRYMIDECVEYF